MFFSSFSCCAALLSYCHCTSVWSIMHLPHNVLTRDWGPDELFHHSELMRVILRADLAVYRLIDLADRRCYIGDSWCVKKKKVLGTQQVELGSEEFCFFLTSVSGESQGLVVRLMDLWGYTIWIQCGLFILTAVTQVFHRQTLVDSDWLLSGWLPIEQTVERILCLIALFGMSEIWSP